jgi:SAM-dependent methyltransferase
MQREMPAPEAPEAAVSINRAYYGRPTPGLHDYWTRMAAPRERAATFLDLLASQPPRHVVDLGCGNGQLLAEIRVRFREAALTGIDLAERQIAANRRTQPTVRWLALDLERPEQIPAELQGAFDAVVAAEIIEHLADPAAFLASARALARPGAGRLLLSTQSGPVRETERRVGHLRHFSAEALAGLVEGAGWRCESVWNCGFPFHDLSKWWANRDPDATMSRFSGQAYGVREKLLCAALRLAFRLNSRRRGAQLYAVAVSR